MRDDTGHGSRAANIAAVADFISGNIRVVQNERIREGAPKSERAG
ncbi:hypothetical protein U91I_00551 [alpha proteobacterium U9-1i]|nr:hypothetical protein U91I_00551 [alpha proteobacterium U9-1i]